MKWVICVMLNAFEDIKLDKYQHLVIDELIPFLANKAKVNILSRIFAKKYSNKYSGIYLYGSTGTGKTLIAKKFISIFNDRAIFTHYQIFMSNIHKAIHNMRKMGVNNHIIQKIAYDISRDAKLICLDELEVSDIADAMIILELFAALVKNGILIFVTSNAMPDALYINGIQRQSFMPFIDFIKSDFKVIELDSGYDYRNNFSSNSVNVLFPINDHTNNLMQEVARNLAGNNTYSSKSIEVFGRIVTLSKVCGDILVTDFKELCIQDLSYNDYIEICKNFTTIILSNVPKFDIDNTNEVIRFINLIDNIYFYKRSLFISLEDAPENLYTKGTRIIEFKRTISRLKEMQSGTYGYTDDKI